jgi:hypothetical protein
VTALALVPATRTVALGDRDGQALISNIGLRDVLGAVAGVRAIIRPSACLATSLWCA